jgi:hypothetical protein
VTRGDPVDLPPPILFVDFGNLGNVGAGMTEEKYTLYDWLRNVSADYEKDTYYDGRCRCWKTVYNPKNVTSGFGTSNPPSASDAFAAGGPGGDQLSGWSSLDMYLHYLHGGGDVSLGEIGLFDVVRNSEVTQSILARFGSQIDAYARQEAARLGAGVYSFGWRFINSYDFSSVSAGIGGATLSGNYDGQLTVNMSGFYSYQGTATIRFRDWFTDPYDLGNKIGGEWNPRGTPYNITGNWERYYSGGGSVTIFGN